MGEDYDGLIAQILGTPKVPAVAATPPTAQPQPPTQPQAAPAATPPAPAQAVPPGETPPVAPAAASPQDGNQPSDPAEAVLAEMQAKEQELFNKILPAFALTPELVAEMESDAVNAVPKVLAKTFMHSVSTSLRYMQQIVPAIIQRELARVKVSDETEKAFFGKFGQLNAKAHGKDIVAFAQMFRQQNPQMTQDDLFARVGAAVMAMHGIVAQPPTAQAPGVVSVTPVQGNHLPQATPFVPAQGGSVVATQPIARAGWEGMGGEYD